MEVSAEFLVNSVVSLLILTIVAYFYWPRSKKSGAGGLEKDYGDAPRLAPAPLSSLAQPAPPPLSRRPETASPGAVAARAAVAKASMAPPSKEQYQGCVKRYSDRNGMGFITCSTLHEKFSADVRVYRTEYEEAGLKVGDGVEFRTILGGRPNCPQGKPWATELKKLDSLPPNEGSSSEDQELRRRNRPAARDLGGPEQESAPDRQSTDQLGRLLARAAAADAAAAPKPVAPALGGLKVDSPEFVPGSFAAAQGCGHTFNVAAAEFVPSGFGAAAPAQNAVCFNGYEEERGEDFD